MPRQVTIELHDAGGACLGALPQFQLEDPWWPSTGPVVEAVADRFGADVWVLHLVEGDGNGARGGAVTYAAELRCCVGGLPVVPVRCGEVEEPLRPLWARPGGTQRILERADALLLSLGRPRVGPVTQHRAWNLSSILELPTNAGPVWAKSVPAFFAHEGPAIEALRSLAPEMLPPLLAHDAETATALLSDIPGRDLYDATVQQRAAMASLLADLQLATVDRVDDLLAIGAPDWRAPALTAAVRAMVWRDDVRAELSGGERDRLDALVGDLPRRFDELAECGLPDTLVHGDAHGGNWRSDGQSLVLLDWGDCGVGHPLLDAAAFEEQGGSGLLVAAWQLRLPHAFVQRAAALIRPVAALRLALIYRTFLDGIEPAEGVYHRSDVPAWLRRALAGG